jgi:hypothetical protein
MTSHLGGDGTLAMTAWPAYIGVCDARRGMPPFIVVEPIDDPNYERGQITWEYRDGQIVGKARIHCPPGEYTHYLYFQHPKEALVTGMVKMPHPVRFTHPTNVLDVDPIINEDLALNVPQAPP